MRNISIDIIRIVACLMVILMHSPMPGDGALAHGSFLTALSYFTSPCVPLFFMVSGALLLKSSSKPEDTKTWLSRRLYKVVFPTIVFSLFYIFVNNPSDNWLRAIISIPFSTQGHAVLWFMYTLIGLYLITPIIKPWINSTSKKDFQLYLSIWIVTLLFPYIQKIVDINTFINGTWYYLTGYVGYYLLGYYLMTYPLNITEKRIIYFLCILVLPLPLLNKVLEWNLDFYSAFWYLSAPVCIMSVGWFVFIYRLFEWNTKSHPVITTLSTLSFGVYLVHIYIMRNVLWNLDIIRGIENYYLQTSVVFVLTLLLSIIVCWAISWLPFGQWIIGTKRGSLHDSTSHQI